MKNKTIASWLALLGGPAGLHRFYLHGWRDPIGWIMPFPSALGVLGVFRIRDLGVDDQLSWLLIPLLGFAIAGSALTAIVYGLTSAEKWQQRFDPDADPAATAAGTNWSTICAIVLAMLIGTTALMSSLAFSFQHVFEYQMLQARSDS